MVLAACGGGGMMTSGDDDIGPDAAQPPGVDAPVSTDVTAQQLLDAIATCAHVEGGPFATDSGGTANVSICNLPTAVFWKADMDIDCDGKMSTVCNLTTDPAYQNQTSGTDSHGNALDAATLPYVVVPLSSSRWNYATAGLDLGSVVAVVYNGRVEYGVFGDEGPSTIIGEASHRMAELLGIDPDPSMGGVDTGVAYIAFTGADARVSALEDHAAAVAIGVAKAKALVGAP